MNSAKEAFETLIRHVKQDKRVVDFHFRHRQTAAFYDTFDFEIIGRKQRIKKRIILDDFSPLTTIFDQVLLALSSLEAWRQWPFSIRAGIRRRHRRNP